MTGITNLELHRLAQDENIDIPMHYICTNDALTNLKRKKKMNIILNLQNSNQGGSHWVALLVRGGHAFYCDSYGLSCDTNVTQYCIKNHLHLSCNSYIIQSQKSTNCGLYSYALIKYIERENIPNDIPRKYKNELLELCNNYINLFVPNRNTNDLILKKYLKNNLKS